MFPSIVVAIPARNEATAIASCLASIDAQTGADGRPLREGVGIVLLINDTSDETYEIACRHAASQRTPMRIFDVTMAPHTSHAGGARRAAMDLASQWLDEGDHDDAVLFTTDADSVPARNWITAASRSLARDADAVAGPIDLHLEDVALLPAHVLSRGALEAQYEALITELFARLDPRPHDPWPCHATEAGANLAVKHVAYQAIGGLPDVACGEDRALCAALERACFRVRHDLTPRVSTSGRLDGRAKGGVADTIRLRCAEPEATCDSYLEPIWNARFRGYWRGRLRRVFAASGAAAALREFGQHDGPKGSILSFEMLWDALEAQDQRLQRRLLCPAELPDHIAAATVMVRRLRAARQPGVQRGRAGNPQFGPAE